MTYTIIMASIWYMSSKMHQIWEELFVFRYYEYYIYLPSTQSPPQVHDGFIPLQNGFCFLVTLLNIYALVIIYQLYCAVVSDTGKTYKPQTSLPCSYLWQPFVPYKGLYICTYHRLLGHEYKFVCCLFHIKHDTVRRIRSKV